MNEAFHHVLEWYFEETGVSDHERDIALQKIVSGSKAGDISAATDLISLLTKAEKVATDDGNDVVLELIDIGKKLVVAESALSKANGLIAIRSIIDLPTSNPIASRIRESRLQELVKGLAD